MTHARLVLALVLGAALGLTAAAADAPARKESPRKPKPVASTSGSAFVKASREPENVEQGAVFTNEDLDKLFGPSTLPPTDESATPPAAVEGAPPPPPADQQQPIDVERARAAEQRVKREEAEKAVATLRETVVDLEKRLLAVRNPLLARPTPPEDEVEREEWERGGSSARSRVTEDQLRDARQKLQDAEAELARLR